MKKFIVFLLLAIFLFSASLFKDEFDFSKMSNLQVQIFTSTKQDLPLNNVKVVDNGDGQIITCKFDDYKSLVGLCENISGVTYIFDGNEQLYENLLKDLNVKVAQKTNSSFLGYTNNFSNCVNFSGKKVNVQGYISQGKIYIGTPLLLGSY